MGLGLRLQGLQQRQHGLGAMWDRAERRVRDKQGMEAPGQLRGSGLLSGVVTAPWTEDGHHRRGSVWTAGGVAWWMSELLDAMWNSG